MRRLVEFVEARKNAIGLVAVAVVLVLCGLALRALLAEMRLSEVARAIRALPPESVLASLGFTLASYLSLIGYDWSALRYVGRRMPARAMALASFCSYAIGNTAGLALLTGGSVRFRVYSAAGLAADDIARVALFCVVAFGFGICAISGFGIMLRPTLLAGILDVPVDVLRVSSLTLVGGVAGFLWLCTRRRSLRWRGVTLPLPSARLVLGQLTISALDVCLACAALHALLPVDLGFSYLEFLPLYCVAIVMGLLSHVPGGLGVFEAVIVFALGDQADKSGLVGALVAYRVVYYVLPLLVAGVLLGINELRQQIAATRIAIERVLDLTETAVPTVASLLAVIAAVVLFASGATPMDPSRAAVIPSIVPLPVVEAAHFLGGIVATALVFVAPGLQQRLNAAYWLACVCLVIGIALSLAKGLDYEEAIVLAVIGVLLVPYRREFYRQTSLLDEAFTPGWILAIAAIVGGALWLTLFAYQHVEYDSALWLSFAFEDDAPRSLRAILAAVMTGLAFAGLHLLRPPRTASASASAEEVAKAEAVARGQDNADALLVLMGDKSLMFSQSGRSFLMFGRYRRTWISLFDPIGDARERGELVWRFREACDRQRLRPAFYQLRPDALPLYIDAGFSLTKLGEEARVPLGAFDLKEPRRGKLRYAINRGTRDGLSFRWLEGSETPAVMDRLEAVSNDWLAMKSVGEKGFSLGAFVPSYVARFEVGAAVLDGEIVAFATLLLTDRRREATLDIMRHRSKAPALTMEFLITSVILALKQRGIEWFNLGMAPLSGLDRRRLAPFRHRLGALVYEHGETFYNFQGLRQFKEKFDPVWEPRYLASPGGLDALIVLADAAALIGGGSVMSTLRK